MTAIASAKSINATIIRSPRKRPPITSFFAFGFFPIISVALLTAIPCPIAAPKVASPIASAAPITLHATTKSIIISYLLYEIGVLRKCTPLLFLIYVKLQRAFRIINCNSVIKTFFRNPRNGLHVAY